MVFYFDDMASVQNDYYREYLPLLPRERQQRVISCRKLSDRNLSVLAWQLLHYACRDRGRGLYQLPVRYGPAGKPCFGGAGAQLHFNLSHCERGAACGISAAAVGVDMQELVCDYETLLDRVCKTKKKRRIQQAEKPVQLFTAFWALKESYVKCLGTGLDDDLPQLDFSAMQENQGQLYGHSFQVWEKNGYMLAECTAASEPEPELRRVSLAQLTVF